MKILGTDTDFDFGQPGPEMFTITCVNHLDGRWLSKNPKRTLFWIGWDRLTEPVAGGRVRHPELGHAECPCPYSDLRVVR